MLETLDLRASCPRPRLKRELPGLQERLRRLQYELREAELATVVLFEGWDAAGKSTVIQRLTQCLDPRGFRQFPGAPPSELEQRYHFLWRYETRLPEDGQMAFFDHSWYSRVLVERVERFVTKKQWKPAFGQINELERWLTEDGQLLVKFFLHISRKEQRRRLKRMEKDPLERWKVQREDWRRNERYDDWVSAVEEMLSRTATPRAPWTLVAATDFRHLRLTVFRTLVERMEAALRHRREAPAEVSRTSLAQAATRGERERRSRESATLARSVARDAGLPIDEERPS
jgi:polyphosphate kinase 2 (PPK2 family)